jgi:hypothetical protein
MPRPTPPTRKLAYCRPTAARDSPSGSTALQANLITALCALADYPTSTAAQSTDPASAGVAGWASILCRPVITE